MYPRALLLIRIRQIMMAPRRRLRSQWAWLGLLSAQPVRGYVADKEAAQPFGEALARRARAGA
ncbi:uncharacterized protein METZ01_LOCUS83434 [marine metagenome]|uniref:Uncharacterized protein n=1 Tax=marine metagenome TaxID=408172 RepID=A0A381UR78_9ZZZZ